MNHWVHCVQRALRCPLKGVLDEGCDSSSRTPFITHYDDKSFVRSWHPMGEWFHPSPAEFKVLQGFYQCSAQNKQNNVTRRNKWAQHFHEDTFTQYQHLCLSSEVSGWSARRWLLASHSGVLESKDTWDYGNRATRREPSVDYGWGENKGCHIIETRIDKLNKEFNVDKNRITGVSPTLKSPAWNLQTMVITTSCSLAPYIYLSGCQQSEWKDDMVFPDISSTHSTTRICRMF